MLKKLFLLLAFVAVSAGSAFAASEPSMQEVYQAAQAGRLIEAQGMIDRVLTEHPKSAKAHFVQAELYAKQGRMGDAASALRSAEQLAPGLPFVKPQALQDLRALITAPRAAAPVVSRAAHVQPAPVDAGMPWGLLLAGTGAMALVVWAARSLGQRKTMAAAGTGYPAYAGAGAPQAAGPMQPYAGGAAPMASGPAAGPAAGGLGSGIMGGLATGAALGVGMVAGQALMHRFTDGNRPAPEHAPPADAAWANGPAPNDMGGKDFGIDDASSWDDGGAGGGGDWDS